MKDTFRKNYGTLTDQQKQQGLAIKTKAEELLQLYKDAKWANIAPEDEEKARCIDRAIDLLESSVMWACKGVYTTKDNL